MKRNLLYSKYELIEPPIQVWYKLHEDLDLVKPSGEVDMTVKETCGIIFHWLGEKDCVLRCRGAGSQWWSWDKKSIRFGKQDCKVLSAIRDEWIDPEVLRRGEKEWKGENRKKWYKRENGLLRE